MGGDQRREAADFAASGEIEEQATPHIIPLSEPALGLLRAPAAEFTALNFEPSDGRYVFGGFAPFKSWHRKAAWLDKAIAGRRGAQLPPWTLHDIRRSVVTHIAELGFAQPHVIEAIVNHISGAKAGVAGVYNRASYLGDKRQALEQWGAYLTGLVGAPLSSPKSTNPEIAEEVGGQLISGTTHSQL